MNSIHEGRKRKNTANRRPIPWRKAFPFSWRDTAITVIVLTCAALLCVLLRLMDDGDIYVSMIFLLAVAVVSRMTNGYFYGIAASVIGVIGVNYAFTAPYLEFSLSMSGYPLAFVSMLVVAVTTSAMTTQIKRQEEQKYRAQVEEMRANLLRAVSHDLRTPLTSISGAASVLLQHPEMNEERREILLREIMDDSGWLVRMVENLLSITRINAEPANLHKDPEAPEEVISETVRKFRKRFGQMPVEISLPEEFVMVPMDPILIEQVLTNLMENVVYHAETATKILLRLRVEAGHAVFEVADDGVGISEKRLEDIFDAVSTSASDGNRGMGIGLSVCKAIIMAHGGEIMAKNRQGGGALFRFTLPIMEEKYESSDDNSDR